jgi:hypothetical protein
LIKAEIILVSIILFLFLSKSFAEGEIDSLTNNAVNVSLTHLGNSIKEVKDTLLFPTYGTKDLKWQLKPADDWTAGFYPGCLWYAYELSSNDHFKYWAKKWTSSLEKEKDNPNTHDLGFKFMCSFGNGFKLDENLRDNYKKIILDAAKTLSRRYNPKVRCLGSNWDIKPVKNSYPVIIDIMMNLELLFWASENGGHRYYYDYARSHAIITARDFIRPDGGTYHIVRYDKYTGEVINKGTMQGAGDETTWARGQAWGIYGFVVAYRYTKEKQFLDDAIKLADYFIDHLPADHVAPWDFQSDIDYRDASAACITASALFEIINYIKNDSLRKHYESEAEAMLSSLCKHPYFTDGKETSCILDHSVQYLPINSNVDVPAIFADYYFLEAILRFKHLKLK